ncbi:transposase [Phyllobacterium brassicacearum]|nr:hypothetical protein [Phyllobacterium brassicacearum]TDQ14851.1 transposase [Phyllobacterium brassicacearum]
METTLEIFTTGRARREGHRHWPDELKARSYRQFAAGRDGERSGGALWAEAAPPFFVAHDGAAGQVGLPAPEDAVEFAAMVVETCDAAPPIREVSRPEIIVGPVIIRLEEGASTARIVAVARAFAASA